MTARRIKPNKVRVVSSRGFARSILVATRGCTTG